jgi:C1A family cysteine protease
VNGGNLYFTTFDYSCAGNTCNFHPTSNSTAIVNKGKDLSGVWPSAKDKDNISRPQGAGWDIGPYEYTGTIPTSYDWRNVGGVNYISDVRNQNIPPQDFNTCTVHAIMAMVEAKAVINGVVSRANADFSEQVLMSCCNLGPYQQCAGHDWGDPSLIMQWLISYGVPLESCAPYVGWDMAEGYGCFAPYVCSTYNSKGYKVSSYSQVTPVTVANLKSAIYNYGPIYTAFDLYEDFIPFFASNPTGIYSHQSGAKTGGHAVLVIGYNDSGSYFICKNSWGTGFGDNGYFKISYSEVGGATQFGNPSYYLGTVYSYGNPTAPSNLRIIR